MASSNQNPDGGYPPRSLSEQLRILEQQLARLSAPSHASTELSFNQAVSRLPTSLGRPVGLAPSPRGALLGVPERYDQDSDDDQASPPSRRSVMHRRTIIGGVSLLLLASTAIIPSLIWHPTITVVSEPETPVEVAIRTDKFADAAIGLRAVRPAELAREHDSTPVPVAEAAPPLSSPQPDTGALTATAPPPQAAPESGSTTPRPRATLTVAERDLDRLSLPLLVSGGGASWAGSAVVIDGLPAEARVSHGLKIAPDTWTVGIADVGQAVLSLPNSTPDRLALSVRVLGANSHELAVSDLQINVVRAAPARMAPIAPAAIFEPAAAETNGELDIEPAPPSRQAVKVQRTKRPVTPASPAAPPVTPRIAQDTTTTPERSERLPATSAWVSTVVPLSPSFAPMPKWAPFSDR